jgi:hypothetical protein
VKELATGSKANEHQRRTTDDNMDRQVRYQRIIDSLLEAKADEGGSGLRRIPPFMRFGVCRPAGVPKSQTNSVSACRRSPRGCMEKYGLEGSVSKRLGAPYRSGPSRGWPKVENPDHLVLHITSRIRYAAFEAVSRNWCFSTSMERFSLSRRWAIALARVE